MRKPEPHCLRRFGALAGRCRSPGSDLALVTILAAVAGAANAGPQHRQRVDRVKLDILLALSLPTILSGSSAR